MKELRISIKKLISFLSLSLAVPSFCVASDYVLQKGSIVNISKNKVTINITSGLCNGKFSYLIDEKKIEDLHVGDQVIFLLGKPCEVEEDNLILLPLKHIKERKDE